MTGKGIVREIKDRVVSIKYCGDGACEDCHSCGGFFEQKKEQIIQASVRDDITVKPGDMVEVFLPPWKAILAGFLVLIVPLLFFIVFYFLGSRIFNVQNDSISVLLGVGGIVLGLALNLIPRFRKKQYDLPEITRVLNNVNGTTIPEVSIKS